MKNTALLLGGIGLLLLGISVTAYVFRGPLKTGKKLIEEQIEAKISEATRKRETIENSTLIIYGKSSINGDEHITVFDKVLWGKSEPLPNGVLRKHTIEANHEYGDGAIFFYKGNDISHSFASWAVHNDRIPAWDNKDISELIAYLEKTK